MKAHHFPTPREIGSPLSERRLSDRKKLTAYVLLGMVIMAFSLYTCSRYSWIKPIFKKYHSAQPAVNRSR